MHGRQSQSPPLNLRKSRFNISDIGDVFWGDVEMVIANLRGRRGAGDVDLNKLLWTAALGLLLSSCGPSPAEQATVFQTDKPLQKGQEIVGLGTAGVSNNPGHADLSFITITNNCRDVETLGDFDVVLDDQGKEMVANNAGQVLHFRGVLTGNSTMGIKFTPSTSMQSENGSVTPKRIPELVVREFHVTHASDIGCGKG
jgi:hypothetical protein